MPFFNSYLGSCSSNLKFGREVTLESTWDILLSMWKYAPIRSVRKFWEITAVIFQTWQAEISEVSVKTLWAFNAVQLLMSSPWGVTEHPGSPYNILCHQLATFQQTDKQNQSSKNQSKTTLFSSVENPINRKWEQYSSHINKNSLWAWGKSFTSGTSLLDMLQYKML